MEEKKIKPKREPMPGLKGMVWLWSSGIPLSRSLPEMLYLYWLEASTMSPGWQPHHTWVGAFGVNEIQWNCNWQMPKSVADSPRPPACLLPSTSAQALCQPFAKNASSGKKEQPSRGPPGSALRMRTSPFLREFKVTNMPSSPVNLQLRENKKSFLFTLCRKYSNSPQFEKKVNWNKLATMEATCENKAKTIRNCKQRVFLNAVLKY